MKNPYYNEFVKLAKKYDQPYEPRMGSKYSMANIAARKISTMHDMYDHRDELLFQYGYAIPHPEVVSVIADALGKEIIEIGCGTGYWASLFSQLKRTVLAFDKYTHKLHPIRKFHPIEEGDESALLNVPESYNLFLCWPEMNTPMAYNCVKNFKGDRIAVVADPALCGDDQFRNALSTKWEIRWHSTNSTWPFINDMAAIYERK